MTDPAVRKQADKQERDRDIIAALFLAMYPEIGQKLKEDLTWAAEHGEDVQGPVKAAILQLSILLTSAAVAAYIQARLRTLSYLRDSIEKDPRLAAQYPKLLEWLREMVRHEDENKDKYYWRWMAVAKQFLDVLEVSILSHLIFKTQDPLQRGAEVEDLARKAGVYGNPYVIEAIFGTMTHDAYQTGIQEINENPLVNKLLKGYQYVTMRDNRVRPTHRAAGELNGGFADKSDTARLAEYNILLHEWGCRCTLVAIYGLPWDAPVLV